MNQYKEIRNNIDEQNHSHAISIIKTSIKNSYKYSETYIGKIQADETIFTCFLLGHISLYEMTKWQNINKRLYDKKMAR